MGIVHFWFFESSVSCHCFPCVLALDCNDVTCIWIIIGLAGASVFFSHDGNRLVVVLVSPRSSGSDSGDDRCDDAIQFALIPHGLNLVTTEVG